jgi:hypothetical protein
MLPGPAICEVLAKRDAREVRADLRRDGIRRSPEAVGHP